MNKLDKIKFQFIEDVIQHLSHALANCHCETKSK